MIDGKSIRNKLIGTDDERAVSPVIGVILMVAITVILAAVIAAFVLELGQGQQANAQAGIQFSEDGEDVTVTVNSIERADEISVESSGSCSGSGTMTSVGQTTDITCTGEGTIQVIGTYQGSDTVLNTYNYE